ncbi:hypothetical protein GUJ93_ZPchr0014g47212 [Zizania palustris]|uniref:Uncharacterized protein n=1 Tax=Zizania palustris TaxID=103762 RepID=A0A8J5VUN5_ZIZPA|nr:hypothetical protein GUJ93_ZPchr0014g47212 [Zizania palustris]
MTREGGGQMHRGRMGFGEAAGTTLGGRRPAPSGRREAGGATREGRLRRLDAPRQDGIRRFGEAAGTAPGGRRPAPGERRRGGPVAGGMNNACRCELGTRVTA